LKGEQIIETASSPLKIHAKTTHTDEINSAVVFPTISLKLSCTWPLYKLSVCLDIFFFYYLP
jgi:hypothetical protein